MSLGSQHQARLTERNASITRRFDEGEKQTVLAKEFGLTKIQISNIVRRYKIERERRLKAERTKKEVRRLISTSGRLRFVYDHFWGPEEQYYEFEQELHMNLERTR